MIEADVSVIIPVGPGAPHWKRCVRSLQRLEPAGGQIVVVLDGPSASAGEQTALARELGADVLALERRMGPAAARNRGAELATGELLFFLDSDVEVPPDLIATLVERFAAQPRDVAAVIGSYDDAPGDPGFLSQYRNLLHHWVHQTSRAEASTFWSGCGAVRRNAFDQVQGFDESYADPSIEDIELGGRLRRAGHAIRLEPTLQVSHLKRWTLGNLVYTDLFRRAIPWTEQMLRGEGLLNDLNVKHRDRLSVVAAGLLPLTLVCTLLVPDQRWPLFAFAVVCLLMMVGLNRGFFRFLLGSRGLGFALRAVPLYWLYLVICGLGFVIGSWRLLTRPARSRTS